MKSQPFSLTDVSAVGRLADRLPVETWRILSCSLIAAGALLGHRTGTIISVPAIILGAACGFQSLISSNNRETPIAGWTIVVGLNCLACFSYVLGSTGYATLFAASLLVCAAVFSLVVSRRLSLVLITLSGGSCLLILVLGWQWGLSGHDTFQLIQGGAVEAWHLRNPYLLTMPQVVEFHHYPYLPGLAIFAAPFGASGDVRLAALLSVIAYLTLAWLVAREGGMEGHRLRAFTIFAITFPLTVEMVQWSFADVYAIGPMAVFLWGWKRKPWIGGVAFLVAASTTVDVVIPLASLLLWVKGMRKQMLLALCVLAVVCGWFAANSGGNFIKVALLDPLFVYHNIVNTINLNGFLTAIGLPWLPSWFGVLVWAGVLAMAILYRPRKVSDAIAAAGLMKVVLSMFAKFAQDNHYLVPALLILFSVACGSGLGGKSDFALEREAQAPLGSSSA